MIQISTELNEARLNAVNNYLGRGGDHASVHLYSGARPALGAEPASAPLVTLALRNPVGTVENGQLKITPTDEALINTSGIATWARVVNGAGELAWDCDVSEPEGHAELRLTTTQLYAGGTTRILSGQLG